MPDHVGGGPGCVGGLGTAVSVSPAWYRFALPMTGKRLYILNRGTGGIPSLIPGKKRRQRRFVVYILYKQFIHLINTSIYQYYWK